jgi:hypothetical protein
LSLPEIMRGTNFRGLFDWIGWVILGLIEEDGGGSVGFVAGFGLLTGVNEVCCSAIALQHSAQFPLKNVTGRFSRGMRWSLLGLTGLGGQ